MARHHYVPKAILREFRIVGNSTLYVHRDEMPLIPKRRNINTIFCRRHYNSFQLENGERDSNLEKFFGEEFDNFIPHWISVFQKHSSPKEPEFENDLDRRRFVQFFYNHSKRSPDFIEPILEKATEEVFNEHHISKIETRFRKLTDAEMATIASDEFISTTTANSRVQNFSRQSEKILETLNEMKIMTAIPARQNKQFVVGSNPVIRFENYPSQKLGEDGVELWTTLTPKLAVGFVSGPVLDHRLSLEDFLVRRINHTLAKNSRAIAGRSEALLISLSKDAW